ncbi:MAG: acetoacetate--CoA ligase [Gemmatimonadaceae bacterium]
MTDELPIWTPNAGAIAAANVTRFIRETVQPLGGAAAAVTDSASLYEWSVTEPQRFWPAVWTFGDMIAERREDGSQWDAVLEHGERMAPPDPLLGPRWFRGAHLNFAENLLRRRDDADALVLWTERGPDRTLTFAQLAADVARFAGFLRSVGVVEGDRVAGFVANVPEAVVAMLASASIGALWSSCSPDFGAAGVVDRFGQIAPKVMVVVDGYEYAGKPIDSLARVREFLPRLPSVERVVVVPHLRAQSASPRPLEGAAVISWREALAVGDGAPLTFARLPFDHPLYIMYSSGTTGLPKCMVHGAGGTLLQHLKELALHTNVSAGDRVFYFTTCGWMMWNWLVSNLAIGATVVLYDGASILRDRPVLWELAARERLTVFGTSAKWIALTQKDGVVPGPEHDLSALRTILSTGSPLAAHSFDFIYERVKADVCLSSISGGTDIISCFAGGDPTRPVYRGEIQTRAYGMNVDVFDEAGRSLRGEPGELVCTSPFPSMPVAFWNDPDGEKYQAAYFDVYPNTWRHGDWAELTERGGMLIHGRSDATLNPGGVRIGTAEIYRQVEQMPEVVESVVIGQHVEPADVRIVLFVRLRPGLELDDALRERIGVQIRTHCSPHHVPKRIVQVTDIPRTISGKITELAVRDVVHGRPVKNVDALANPEALGLFRDRPELRG